MSTNLPTARNNLEATRRSRTATNSRRCSGRAPEGPGADIARKWTPASAYPRGLSSCSKASLGTARATSGRELFGNNCLAHSSCFASSNSATSVCRDAAALLYAPSVTNIRARRALLPCFAHRRFIDAASHIDRHWLSARFSNSSNEPALHFSNLLANSHRTFTPRGTGPSNNLARANSKVLDAALPSAIPSKSSAIIVECRCLKLTGTCTTDVDGKTPTLLKKVSRQIGSCRLVLSVMPISSVRLIALSPPTRSPSSKRRGGWILEHFWHDLDAIGRNAPQPSPQQAPLSNPRRTSQAASGRHCP